MGEPGAGDASFIAVKVIKGRRSELKHLSSCRKKKKNRFP